MNKQDILDILVCVGEVDLSISGKEWNSILKREYSLDYIKTIENYVRNECRKPIPVMPYSYYKLYGQNGDRAIFEGDERGYFPRRGRLAAFGILSLVYQRKEDIQELEDIIWAVCDEYTWSLPAHLSERRFTQELEHGDYTVDLFAGETADTLAEISYLMGDILDPLVRKRIAHQLEERIFSQVMWKDFGWVKSKSNWAAVCAGSVGMAAIYTIKDDEYLAAVLERILPAMDSFLASFPEDGACFEGIHYWTYGFSYFISFADLLYRRTAGKINLFAKPKVSEIAALQQKCYFAGGRTVSFSDGETAALYTPGLTCYLRKKFKGIVLPPYESCSKHIQDDGCFRWNNILRNLLWTDECLEESGMRYSCYQLPRAQWYIGNGTGGVGIAAKAGCNGEPHNHNDIGCFQIYRNGEEMISDLGSGEYTRQYFGEERYSFLNCGSQGHSVPIIDGCTQRAGKNAAAVDVDIRENGISMDIAPAYEIDSLCSLRRSIQFHAHTGLTVLTDTYDFSCGKHDIRERFITYGNIRQKPGEVILQMGKEKMSITYDPKIFSAELIPFRFVNHIRETKEVFALDFHASVQEHITVKFTIAPV